MQSANATVEVTSYTVYGAGPVVGALNGASNLIGPTPPRSDKFSPSMNISQPSLSTSATSPSCGSTAPTPRKPTRITDQTAFDAIISSIHNCCHRDMAQRAARRHRSATRPRGRDPRRSHRHPPPGFGPATVANTGPVGTRLQLGIEATTETACGWIDTWLTATASRDQETKAAATAALAESRQWKFLVDNPGGERRSGTTWTQPTTAKSSENPHPWTSPSQTRFQLHRLSDAPTSRRAESLNPGVEHTSDEDDRARQMRRYERVLMQPLGANMRSEFMPSRDDRRGSGHVRAARELLRGRRGR